MMPLYMQKNYFFMLFLLLVSCQSTGHQSVSSVEQKPLSPPIPKPAGDSLDFKIGQMIMIGIGEITSLSAHDALALDIQQQKVGGIVLYEKNISKVNAKANLKKLVEDFQRRAGVPLFVSIDEEGGKVHRLKAKYGFIDMPSAAYLGALDDADSTYLYTRKLAKLMAEMGINLNYAPTVDLALNKDNPVIARLERSYSDDPKIVAKHAISSIRAFHDFDIKTIIKHFPGHGSSAEDTHWGMADVTNKWKFSELMPYKEIIKSGECDAIMTAHIIHCHLDPDCLPATLSKKIITGIIRDFMEFDGVVFSDDMQMHAISKNYGLKKAIMLALKADIDVLMFANNVNPKERISASEIHQIIKDLILSDDISKEKIDISYKRIAALKRKNYLL